MTRHRDVRAPSASGVGDEPVPTDRRIRVVARVSPDVFAIVMATGIVSVAAADHGYRIISRVGDGVSTAMFVALAGAAVYKIATRRHVVRAEIDDPGSVFGMFTFVAAAAVLSVVWEDEPWLTGLATLSMLVAWGLFVPLAVRAVVRTPWSRLRARARGGWLLASVATSGLAVVAARKAVTDHLPNLVWVAVALWILAVLAYAAIATLVVWRVASADRPLEAATPDGWILMGALAIATLAASMIHRAAQILPELTVHEHVFGVVDAVTWVAATGWIPVLAAFQTCVLVRARPRVGFANPWWSAVFPAGMYSIASSTTGVQVHGRMMDVASTLALWVAFAAWAVTTAAMARAALRWFFSTSRSTGPVAQTRSAQDTAGEGRWPTRHR